MKRFLLLASATLLTLTLPVTAELTEGKVLPELSTVSGRTYRQVLVRKIEADGVRVMHQDGAATIPASELPQFAELFDALRTESPASEDAGVEEFDSPDLGKGVAAAQEPPWHPQSVDDVATCSLLVQNVRMLTEDDEQAIGSGSAFLCNLGGVTYIYSNVHNFFGAESFEIVDSFGVKYNDFESVEVAASGEGYLATNAWGGDVIRIKLRNYRPQALSLDPTPVSQAASHGRKIVVTGNTRGEGVITRLEGVIRLVDEQGIIHHTAATEGGNSGSPIVDLETLEVLGILTWGSYDSRNPLSEIWRKTPEDRRESRASGASLLSMRFVPSSFEKLRAERIWLNDLKKAARLFGLMDILVPAKHGLFLDPNAVVMGDYKVEDIIRESSGNPILAELVTLDRWLKSYADSNIGISNQDMLKRYIEVYERCVALSARQRANIDPGPISFYAECRLKNTRTMEIWAAYERAMMRSIAWYQQQRGTAGGPLPLAKRYRLPQFSEGLSALGIQAE